MTFSNSRRQRLAQIWQLGAGIAASTALPYAFAQSEWPARPVKLVVPFPAGGPTDMVARVLAVKLGEQLGQQFIVDNRGGANGNIGAEVVAHAPADGYTLLYNTSSIVLSRALYSKLNYDLSKDLTPVAHVAAIPMVLAVNPAVPAKSLKEFIALMKAEPGKFTYASPGNGNIGHLASLLIVRAAGVEATHIPYKGSAPALTDVSSGQVQFMTDSANSIVPFIKENRLRALAVTSDHRLAVLPDTPTLAEVGLTGVEAGVWQGVIAPAGTPAPIIRKLSGEIAKALENADVRAKLVAQSAEPQYMPPDKYGAYLQAETQRWGKVIKDAKVSLD